MRAPSAQNIASAQGILPTGVMCVLPTPFDDEGRVDYESLRNVASYAIDQGATALVCFGLASEGYKLTDEERTHSLKSVIEVADGQVPVIAGSENNSAHSAARRTADYVDAGATAVMVMPPSFVKPNVLELTHYYQQVADSASGRPVIIQDAPGWTGVQFPIDLIKRLRELAPNIMAVKVENPPSHSKISTLKEMGFVCVGGYGGLHLLEDLDAGISGVMYGAGTVRAMVSLWSTVHSDPASAWDAFQRLLPVLTFQMSSLDIFIAVQKELLHQSGVIASKTHREPGQPLTEHHILWLKTLMDRLGRQSR